MTKKNKEISNRIDSLRKLIEEEYKIRTKISRLELIDKDFKLLVLDLLEQLLNKEKK